MGSDRSVAADGDIAFRILGAVQLSAADGEVRTVSGRQLAVLSLLLVRARQVVSVDQLVDASWNEAPPSTARAQIQFCIHALRAEFDRMDLPAKIVTQSPGYRLDVADEDVDSLLFENMVHEARDLARNGMVDEASSSMRRALRLWRGASLDCDSRVVRDHVAWLDELHLEVIEECLGHELELGRHRELVGELKTLVAEHPLKEQFRYLLMLALYRSGRQNDALSVYRDGRALMVEELGLDPGVKLQRLSEAILADDETLLVQAPRTSTADSRTSWGRPRQLPTTIGDFAGRDELVDMVGRLLASEPEPGPARNAVPIVSLTGRAGVGKSALAVHVAHQVATEHFPDGQLYINLHSNAGNPVTAREALGRFLRAMGVNGASIPDSEDERGEMYRGLLADRRVLVVLEDAANEAQVRPVVPGSPTCAVLVTSRARLTGLFGSRIVPIDVLSPRSSLAMLEGAIGRERVERERDAAGAIVAAVGGLPLALRVVGARLAAHPHWTLQSMVDRLADETRRLDELRHGDMVVRSSLEMTCEVLDVGAADLMNRLGGLDADDLPAWTAAAVLDDAEGDSLNRLDRLVDAHLVDTTAGEAITSSRYRFHDLVRIFARERLRQNEPSAESESIGRVLGGWLQLTGLAHRRLYGGEFVTLHGDGARWPVPAAYTDDVVDDPLRWLESERANICSAIRQGIDFGLDELCWDLSVSMVSLFEVRSYFDDWLATHEHSLAATRAAGNDRGSAALLCSLGSLYLNQSRLERARSALMPALELFAGLDDARGLALTRRNLGLLERMRGVADSARAYYVQSLEGFVVLGDLVGEASVLSQVAQIDLDEGDHGAALVKLERAAGICGEVRSPRIESQVRYKLGKALLALGEYESAGQVMAEVLDLVKNANDVQGESYAVHMLGVIERKRGRLARAAELLEKAIDLCARNLDHVGVARAQLELADVELTRGAPKQARMLAEQAHTIFVEYKIPKWALAAERQLRACQGGGGR